MRDMLRRGVLALALAIALPGVGMAQGLRVSPVTLEVPAPGAATTLTIRNEGREPVTVQSRAFRWTQYGGREALQRTNAVVVSPPAVRLPPGATQIIRVVRTSKSAVRGEEAYRVIVNEVPDQSRRRSGSVAFASELRIPVFFVGRGARNPDVSFAVRNSGGAAWLVAQNRGDTRLRLADVQLGPVRQPGLVGYVLGGSTMQWPVAPAGRVGNGARLRAATNFGALDARVGR
ncbi:fimbrial biogenesis chaperone [Paracoccus laeviglucosivorans]|uniref:Fimbrial chaperone protein n=1 Tax=Paracoccus laeviglucosivorans TaxID=1197861 RepID=A0A521B982_9RHOB|nr:molecular chaperone [Paracoccus laeviglucosivorans]SMO43615.1 fimbrial chaperone protein [Paracoccus laeviglucosivorans]